MNDPYKHYTSEVNQIFERQFTDIYKQSNARTRAKLLPFISTIYRRWYYSTLIEHTPLTPANICEAINRAYSVAPCTQTVAVPRSTQRYNGLIFEEKEYTLEQHPITDDFRHIVEYCLPDIELTEDDSLSDHQFAELTERLSLPDPHYAAFLLNIAVGLGFLVKIPSIYANRAQVVREYDVRLNVPCHELFEQIVEATIKMATFSLNEIIAIPEPLFNEHFIRSILKKPMKTDDIFQRVYDMMGLTMEDLLDVDIDDEDMDIMDMAVISGTFLLGIILDKFFYTPFSHYLKLIRPVYELPFDFENEIKYFLESGFDDDELYTAFFAPCSHYSLTDLGLRYFKIKPDENNYLDVEALLPFASLKERFFGLESLSASVLQSAFPQADGEPIHDNIYTIKIKSEPSCWLNLEIPSSATLHRLYLEAAALFDLNCNGDYSFFHDTTENPFTEYVSPKNAKRAKKTANIALNALDFEHKQDMILSAYHQSDPIKDSLMGLPDHSTVRLTLSFMNVKPMVLGRTYPAVSRMSKELKDMEAARE